MRRGTCKTEGSKTWRVPDIQAEIPTNTPAWAHLKSAEMMHNKWFSSVLMDDMDACNIMLLSHIIYIYIYIYILYRVLVHRWAAEPHGFPDRKPICRSPLALQFGGLSCILQHLGTNYSCNGIWPNDWMFQRCLINWWKNWLKIKEHRFIFWFIFWCPGRHAQHRRTGHRNICSQPTGLQHVLGRASTKCSGSQFLIIF